VTAVHVLFSIFCVCYRQLYCRLKAFYYCNYFWGRKINLSGISPAKRTAADPDQIRYTWASQGVTTFKEFWARSAQFWVKCGLGPVPRRPNFCVVIQRTFWQLRNGRFSPNLVKKRSSVSRRRIRKDIFENLHFRGHFPPTSEIENRSNRHLTQSMLP